MNRPPVLVMNPYYSGLGIARSLRDKGIHVYALTSERQAPGARSRYFRQVYQVPNGRDEPERLRDSLLEIRAAHTQRPVIFPTRDFDVLFLHEYRDALAEAYVLPQAENSSILSMMDKFELAKAATVAGIPVPVTVVCGSLADLELHVSTLVFPVVIKPRFAYQWRRKGLWEQLGAAKAIIVGSPQELRAQYARISKFTPEILLQQYVAGDDSDIVVCCCYIGRDGEVLGQFTGRKLKQDPPLVGTGCIVEASSVPAIVELSKNLLKIFKYRGLAEVEFKCDKRNDRYCLIEVNPRHWDQHELGTLVGVNLSWIAYRDLLGLAPAPSEPSYETGGKYKWIAERELVLGMAKGFVQQIRAARSPFAWLRGCARALCNAVTEVFSLAGGKRILGFVSFRDPLPGAAMFAQLLAEACTIALIRPIQRLISRSTLKHQRQQ